MCSPAIGEISECAVSCAKDTSNTDVPKMTECIENCDAFLHPARCAKSHAPPAKLVEEERAVAARARTTGSATAARLAFSRQQLAEPDRVPVCLKKKKKNLFCGFCTTQAECQGQKACGFMPRRTCVFGSSDSKLGMCFATIF